MTAPFRLTLQTRRLIEHLLAEPEADHYGFEILKATGLKPGTLYPTFARLEGAGWIEGRWERIDPETARRPARRYYRLTAQGQAAASHAIRDAYIGVKTENPAPSVFGIADSAGPSI